MWPFKRRLSSYRWRVSFFKLDEKRGYEVVSDSFPKILGYLQGTLDQASGIADGWSVQVENRSGVGLNVTDELFDESEPSKALFKQAMFLDGTKDYAREEPRFIEYQPTGKRRELPIFKHDDRSIEERLRAASADEPEDEKPNIFSVLREALLKQ
ncbi:hypothetical protein [Rhodovulum euryhalinum]|uniref:hypothetical protein n=1 Tax=Rhodovulum euryhalinum TaxID=35805 RepID=UPI0010527330|nr:hypothetical protein [Rhodovulum euryhalinum]